MGKKSKSADAEYIASMCNKLAALAEQNGFDVGSYLLKIACLEFTGLNDQLNARQVVKNR